MIEENIQLASERDLFKYKKAERPIFPQVAVSPKLSIQKSLESLDSKNFIKMEHMKDHKYIPSTTNQEALTIE